VAGALARATELAGLHLATADAAAHLGVDIVAASVLDEDGVLHEITSNAAIDTATYAVADYPATRAVLDTRLRSKCTQATPTPIRPSVLC
jgi:hypothetical protein